jgi:hypothetical protein
MSYKSHVHGDREPHSGIVPTKRSNEGRGGPKEIVEGRPLTKENAEEPNPYRTPSRESGPNGLDLPKAFLYTWLAWQDEPGQHPGAALTRKILDPHAASAVPFVNWFRQLYVL